MIINQGTIPTVVFLLVDATDDETAETGLSPTVQISKNGGSFATVTNSVSEIANGWYKVALTATETNTVGPLIVRATGTGADEWRDVHQVVDFADFQADVSALATASGLAALENLSEAEVNAQVLDVLNVDTFSELTGVPPDDATITQMIRWLYLLARNKLTQTADTQTVLADDGSTTVATSTISDNGTTTTRGEYT